DRHCGRAAAQGLRRQLLISEDPRPALLRVRAGLGRGGARDVRRQREGGEARARRRRPQAVARPRGRGRVAQQAGDGRELRARRRHPAARRARLRRQRLQDRARPPRDGARPRPSGARHAAVADRQADRVRRGKAMTQLTSMNTATHTSYIGLPVSRVDGRMKVTGTAKYAAEHNLRGLAHGHVIGASIAKGRIRRIDVRDALAIEGVIDVLTHEHRPRLASSDDKYKDDVAPSGAPYRPLYDDEIRFSGQPVALVVAEELEVARFAASFVCIEYVQDEHVTDFAARLSEGTPNPETEHAPHGDVAEALAGAPVRIEAEYRMPVEHHNPMETFAATAVWEGEDQISVFDKTQGALNSRNYLADVLGLPREKVRVISPFVGGAFGSGLRPQYQLPLAALAARELQRPVRVVLTRQQMFTLGYRPANTQTLALGAEPDGRLVAFRHEAIGMTSQFEDFQRNLVGWSRQLYACANSELVQKLVKVDLNTPCDMRAPGGAEGLFAIECAMDELAYAADVDPLELRLRNYSEVDQDDGDKPYSSKELRACYRQGAEKFGWVRRSRAPRSMREGRELVGWGMATGIWEAMQMQASARLVLGRNGDLEVASAFADIGTGTYTMMTQIA